ncbi:MAG: hypothetical protein WD225_13265 [Ilumatobacteraceae bacterium]
MNVSLDGYIEDRDGSFAFSVPDDALHEHANEQTRGTSSPTPSTSVAPAWRRA